jgi:hypothetical protein
MDLYSAVVTTTPFLLVALLVDLRAFGPAPGRTKRVERSHDRRTDRQVLLSLGVGFAAALLGLAFEQDNVFLRSVATVGLGIGAALVFVIMWRDIEGLYAGRRQGGD